LRWRPDRDRIEQVFESAELPELETEPFAGPESSVGQPATDGWTSRRWVDGGQSTALEVLSAAVGSISVLE
jgi:hypothetical protein